MLEAHGLAFYPAPLRTVLVERGNALTAPVAGRAPPALLAPPIPEGRPSTPFPGGTHGNLQTWGLLPGQGRQEAQDKSKHRPLLGRQPRRWGDAARGLLLHAACPRPGTQRKWVTGLRVCVPWTGARAATAHPRIMLLTEAPGPGYNLARHGPSPAAPPKQQEGLSWLTGVDGVGEAPSGRWTGGGQSVPGEPRRVLPWGRGASRLRSLLPAPGAPITERLGNGV